MLSRLAFTGSSVTKAHTSEFFLALKKAGRVASWEMYPRPTAAYRTLVLSFFRFLLLRYFCNVTVLGHLTRITAFILKLAKKMAIDPGRQFAASARLTVGAEYLSGFYGQRCIQKDWRPAERFPPLRDRANYTFHLIAALNSFLHDDGLAGDFSRRDHAGKYLKTTVYRRTPRHL